jgi:hypothetical protein
MNDPVDDALGADDSRPAATNVTWLLSSGLRNAPRVDEAVVERASAIDRAWFKRHPTRAYRLRLPVPNEFPDDRPPAAGAERLVLVKQVLPGARLRWPIWAVQRPRDCDASLGGAWEMCAPESVKQIALGMATVLLLEAGR